MKQNKAEDWEQKIIAELTAEYALLFKNKKIRDGYIKFAMAAISKTEQHFKDIANKMPYESYVKRQVERERQETAKIEHADKLRAKIKELRSEETD